MKNKKLTIKQHSEIYKHLEKVSKMSLDELRAFDEKWNFAKPDLDSNVFMFVNRGVISQMAVLMEICDISPMCVMAEIVLEDGGVER